MVVVGAESMGRLASRRLHFVVGPADASRPLYGSFLAGDRVGICLTNTRRSRNPRGGAARTPRPGLWCGRRPGGGHLMAFGLPSGRAIDFGYPIPAGFVLPE